MKRDPLLNISIFAAVVLHLILLASFGYVWVTQQNIAVLPKIIRIRLSSETQAPEPETLEPSFEQLKNIEVPKEQKAEPQKPSSPSKKAEITPSPTPQIKRHKGSKFGNSTSAQAKLPDSYIELLQVAVQEASYIPHAAREKNIKGSAVLRLSFNRSGYVVRYSLMKKSGSKILDQSALAIGKRLMSSPLPPVPADFDQSQEVLHYDFPISFDPQNQ